LSPSGETTPSTSTTGQTINWSCKRFCRTKISRSSSYCPVT
jgi:hypothetical protein